MKLANKVIELHEAKTDIKKMFNLPVGTYVRITMPDGDWADWERSENKGKKYWAILGNASNDTSGIPSSVSDDEMIKDFVTKKDTIKVMKEDELGY